MPLSPYRKWLFRFIALLVMPLLFLGGLEMILRLSGYGYATGFFEKVRIGEEEFLVNNENFSRRFFPPELERSPSAVMLEAKKPANTYRIFILGESAARGDLAIPYAASRYLEMLLNERFRKTHFEVANLGITAINSHVILPIARDSARASGDLWIIYMGNNEMVGPFGAGTVFGSQAVPLTAVRINLAVQRMRVGQLLMSLARKLAGKSKNPSWAGMEMFLNNEVPPGDPRRETVYMNFEFNLRGIVRAGLDSGSKMLLNTVAVNLNDCPPFASLTNSNLPASDRAQFDKSYAEACSAQAQSDFVGASQKFALASKLDPRFAELHYRRAQCLAQMTDFTAAREDFQKACDDDALPFRADSRINAIIQEIGQEFASDKLTFFDAVSALEKNLPSGICGRETFYEHVHFNFDGNFRLGRAWAEQVEKMLPAEISRDAGSNGWASQQICERRLGLTDWNRYATTEMVIGRLHDPPFSEQSNNAERLQWLENKASQLRQQMNPATAQTAAETYQEAIQHSPRDHFVVENFAVFLESSGHLKEAAAQWQRVCELLPHDCMSYYMTGRLLSSLGQWSEAAAALTRAVTLRPRLTGAWYELGHVHLRTEKFGLALHDYERAAQLDPREATCRAFIGKALSKLNRHAEAIQNYRQALKINPDLWDAHFALGDELAAANQIDDAKNEYAEAVRLNPGNALTHLNLGMMEVKLGLFDDALKQFEETLRLEPGNPAAREFIHQMQNRKNHPR